MNTGRQTPVLPDIECSGHRSSPASSDSSRFESPPSTPKFSSVADWPATTSQAPATDDPIQVFSPDGVDVRQIPSNRVISDYFWRFLVVKKSKYFEIWNFESLLGCLKSRSSRCMMCHTRHVTGRPWFFLFYALSEVIFHSCNIGQEISQYIFSFLKPGFLRS